jgi:hypothetical protein
MNEEDQCKNCSYFFGREGVHCAIHPYGKKSEYCSDWQQNINLQKEKLMNNKLRAEGNSYKKTVAITLNIAFIVLCGYGFSQGMKSIDSDDEKYNKYNQDCKIFLERAGYAGTIGVAQDELEVAVTWMKTNYSTQAFEYKDLKANLDYLKKQPKEGVVPIAIKDSIKQNSITLEKRKFWETSAQNSAIKRMFMVMTGLLLTLGVLILASLFNEDVYDE